jgi:hypothetical protein
MSKPSHSRHRKPPLEVSIMFEPHRLQHDLLREAYASLLPETRRHLVSRKQSLAIRETHSPGCAERKGA